LEYPASWGGGSGSGIFASIAGAPTDQVLLRNKSGAPLALFRPHGLGGIILPGYDSLPDSLDGGFRYDCADHLRGHTLARLLHHLGIVPEGLRTGQACCYKESLSTPARDFLLFYSHRAEPFEIPVTFRSSRSPRCIMELSAGRLHDIIPADDPGWFSFQLTLRPGRGQYFVVE